MKPDHRITKLAQVLVKYSLGVKERDKVAVVGSTASELLLREIYQELLLSGAHPTLHIEFQDRNYLYYKLAKDFQIEYTDPFFYMKLRILMLLLSSCQILIHTT